MESGFRSCHPYVVFFYYMCVGSFAMYFNHPVFLLVGCCVLCLVTMSHGGANALKKWMPTLLSMSLAIILLNPFLNSRGTHVFFYFRGKQVTMEATMYGVVMALSIVMILLLFISFNLVLNGNKFLFIFSSLLPRTAFMTMLAIRFVPLLKRRLDEISDVQRVKGMSMTTGSLRDRVKNAMTLLQILLTWSLQEAMDTADSMKARGYGTGKRSPYIPYKMDKRDKGWLATMGILFALCLAGGMLGYGKMIIYPALGTLQFYLLDWVLLACMLGVLAFPLFVEGREQFKWRFSI